MLHDEAGLIHIGALAFGMSIRRASEAADHTVRRKSDTVTVYLYTAPTAGSSFARGFISPIFPDRNQPRECERRCDALRPPENLVHPLLLALDLDRAGLEKAKAAFDNKDVSGALRAVVAYFRARREPDQSLLAVADAACADEANRAIRREFVFYNEPGTVPAGDWDWTWKPGTDWEWTWALNRHYYWKPMTSAYLATRE